MIKTEESRIIGFWNPCLRLTPLTNRLSRLVFVVRTLLYRIGCIDFNCDNIAAVYRVGELHSTTCPLTYEMNEHTAMNGQNEIDTPVILIGLMGAGKTSVGRKLAELLNFPFVDADQEIEAAAGCTIEDFFELHGEPEFRKGEEKVIKRLLKSGNQVLATGGGAYMNPSIREAIAKHGVSIWLRADLDILCKRTGRRGGRPLLNNANPEEVLQKLMDERYPTYEKADIVVDTSQESIDLTASNILESLVTFTRDKNQTQKGLAENA